MTEDKTAGKGIWNHADYFFVTGVLGAEVHIGLTLIISGVFVTVTALDMVVGIGINAELTLWDIGVTPVLNKLEAKEVRAASVEMRQNLQSISTKCAVVKSSLNETKIKLAGVAVIGAGMKTAAAKQATAVQQLEVAIVSERIAAMKAGSVANLATTVVNHCETIGAGAKTVNAGNKVVATVTKAAGVVSKIVTSHAKVVTEANETIASRITQAAQIFM